MDVLTNLVVYGKSICSGGAQLPGLPSQGTLGTDSQGNVIGGSSLSGTGVANRLVRWSSTNTVGVSNWSDNDVILQALKPVQVSDFSHTGMQNGAIPSFELGEMVSSPLEYIVPNLKCYTDFQPGLTNQYSLGRTTAVWKQLHVGDIYCANQGRFAGIQLTDPALANLAALGTSNGWIVPGTPGGGGIGGSGTTNYLSKWSSSSTLTSSAINDNGSVVTVARNFLPASTNAYYLGDTSYRWARIYSVVLEANGYTAFYNYRSASYLATDSAGQLVAKSGTIIAVTQVTFTNLPDANVVSSLPHGITAGSPYVVGGYLLCKTANLGFQVGDRVSLEAATGLDVSSADITPLYQIWTQGTQVRILTSSNGGDPYLINPSVPTQQRTPNDRANWSLVLLLAAN